MLQDGKQMIALRERAPGVSVDQIMAATAAPLLVAGAVPEMRLGR
ncbi:hypothetical protein [Paracraurococcus lichenis]|uniref:Uncharacterized protein n=1 Tax=Paracraurococcus lichenis TaxID=3064888 RepID=A0ABT9DUS1_9PROT|nr:hypothetical protein [Paracraurococcus sp. LOR1-02]MDO9707649.1 hypothetical protein [Paracraurococcus sp. LOR1-02]